jgi:hypothetical protein
MIDCADPLDKITNRDRNPATKHKGKPRPEPLTQRAKQDRAMSHVDVPAEPEIGVTAGKSQVELAIWSLICAVLVLPPVGIVLGVIARRKMRALNNFDGGKIAWAGIIIGAVYTAYDAFLIYASGQRLEDWINGAVEECVPLYIVLQIWFGYAWSGRWRIAALAPSIVFVPVLIYAFAGLAQGANLWPLPLIVLFPLGVAYLLGLRITHAIVNRRA